MSVPPCQPAGVIQNQTKNPDVSVYYALFGASQCGVSGFAVFVATQRGAERPTLKTWKTAEKGAEWVPC